MGLPDTWLPHLTRRALGGSPAEVNEAPTRKRRRDEDALQRAVCQYLALRRLDFHSHPNERKAHPIEIARLKAMGMMPGIADLEINVGPSAYFIELKTETGRLSPAQRTFRDDCRRLGKPWGLARSVEDVAELLKGWNL